MVVSSESPEVHVVMHCSSQPPVASNTFWAQPKADSHLGSAATQASYKMLQAGALQSDVEFVELLPPPLFINKGQSQSPLRPLNFWNATGFFSASATHALELE